MNKCILIISLLVLMFSCQNKDDKSKESIKIDSLKQVISSYKKQIGTDEIIRKRLYKEDKLKQSKIRFLQKERDSFIKLNSIATAIDATTLNTVFADYYTPLDYKVTSDDNYWKRGIYYRSKKKNEYLFNVRAGVVDNELRFYFLGVIYPLEGGELIASIYELNENKEIHRIDTIDLSPGVSANEEYDPKAERHMQKYMLLQLANLVVKDDALYYYKINRLDYKKIVKRDYYKYDIGSKRKAKKLDNQFLSNVISITAEETKIISPDKTKVALTFLSEDLGFYQIPDWKKATSFLFTKSFYDFDLEKELKPIDFDFKKHFNYSEDQFLLDEDTKKEVLFGGVCWHPNNNVFYFDNSGIVFRCIWEINFETNKITKIVPEHEAIHPYFFQLNSNEYIAYVEDNKIMISESPNNEN